MTYEAALKCAHPGCEFVALSKAGLTNHTRQKHQQPQLAQCAHCHRTFHHQGLLNHQRFCTEIPGNCIHTTTHFSLACITPLFHKNRGVQTASLVPQEPWSANSVDGWMVCVHECVCAWMCVCVSVWCTSCFCYWWWDHTGFYQPVYSTRTAMILKKLLQQLRPTLRMSSNFRSSSTQWITQASHRLPSLSTSSTTLDPSHNNVMQSSTHGTATPTISTSNQKMDW